MKIEYAVEPLIKARPMEDLDIRTHGCVGVQLMFILRPSEDTTQNDLMTLTQDMMLAACNVINQINEGDPSCHGTSPTPNQADTISSGQQPEKSSVILPPNETLL
jgi:hypothetical protein